jgi:hypothetical protein
MNEEPCSWYLCVRLADDALRGVELIFEGKLIRKERVPLCDEHMRQFGVSRRMNLNPVFLLATAP